MFRSQIGRRKPKHKERRTARSHGRGWSACRRPGRRRVGHRAAPPGIPPWFRAKPVYPTPDRKSPRLGLLAAEWDVRRPRATARVTRDEEDSTTRQRQLYAFILRWRIFFCVRPLVLLLVFLQDFTTWQPANPQGRNKISFNGPNWTIAILLLLGGFIA